jgi:hypothetical protein
MAEAADDGRRYRVMTTSYHSMREAPGEKIVR